MKKKQTAATITVEWGYDLHSITLTPNDWAKVKSGRPLSVSGGGYRYEGEFLEDDWSFSGGLDGELLVTYGDDSGEGFVGQLSDADIEEHESQPMRRSPSAKRTPKKIDPKPKAPE